MIDFLFSFPGALVCLAAVALVIFFGPSLLWSSRELYVRRVLLRVKRADEQVDGIALVDLVAARFTRKKRTRPFPEVERRLVELLDEREALKSLTQTTSATVFAVEEEARHEILARVRSKEQQSDKTLKRAKTEHFDARFPRINLQFLATGRRVRGWKPRTPAFAVFHSTDSRCRISAEYSAANPSMGKYWLSMLQRYGVSVSLKARFNGFLPAQARENIVGLQQQFDRVLLITVAPDAWIPTYGEEHAPTRPGKVIVVGGFNGNYWFIETVKLMTAKEAFRFCGPQGTEFNPALDAIAPLLVHARSV